MLDFSMPEHSSEAVPNRAIPYGRQTVSEEDISAVAEALRSDFLTQGSQIDAFENAFAEYVHAPYAVAVSNGTAALHLCALALGVNAGTRVITSPITFVASANCVRYCGGEVDFSDIDSHTYCLDLEGVRSKLASRPRGYYSGVIPVDFAGYPVNMKAWKDLANEFGLWIIEDACHAPGAKSKSHTAGDGSYADLAIFSFHPVKHITTGEGGMITTANKELYDKLRILRTHGITKDPHLMAENQGGWYYEMQELGFNYRLTDIQAALGSAQLKHADKWLKRRHEIATTYDAAFASNPSIRTPQTTDAIKHAYHLYVIQVDDRIGLYEYLRRNGIYTQVHYIPVHLQPYYKKQGFNEGMYPQAEQFYKHCLSLPMFPGLTEVEQKFVIECVMSFVGK